MSKVGVSALRFLLARPVRSRLLTAVFLSAYLFGATVSYAQPYRVSDELDKADHRSTAAVDAVGRIASTVTDKPAGADPAQRASLSGSGKYLPPDKDVQVPINPDAPAPFKAMAECYQSGDRICAQAYAGQFVRYLSNVMFQVRELTSMIGEALVEEGIVSEEDWIGTEDFIIREQAESRAQDASAIKATHDAAMRRIKSDPAGKAEIYFFFALNSASSRQIAPDVERLWRVVQGDPNLKMVGLSLTPLDAQYLRSFREYTGLTLPVQNGVQIAKALRIGFVPAVLVLSPGQKRSWLKTGVQDFSRLYEFVRTVQGASTEVSPGVKRIATTKIGFVETGKLEQSRVTAQHVAVPKRAEAATLDSF
jgi:hypothetical protein